MSVVPPNIKTLYSRPASTQSVYCTALEVLVARWDVETKTERWTAKTGYVNLNARLRYHYLRAPYRLVSEEITTLPKTQRPPPLLCPYLYELDELESRPGPSLEAVHDRAHLVDHLVSVLVSRK